MKSKLPQIRILQIRRLAEGRVLASAEAEIGEALVLKGVLLIQDTPTSPLRLQGPSVLCSVDSNGTLAPRSCVRYRKPFRRILLAAVEAAYVVALQEVQ